MIDRVLDVGALIDRVLDVGALIAVPFRLALICFDQRQTITDSWLIASWYIRLANRILSIALAITLVFLYGQIPLGKVRDVLLNASLGSEGLTEVRALK
jgi:hypothetical protein